MDAQADLHLCCSHMAYDTFSHGLAQIFTLPLPLGQGRYIRVQVKIKKIEFPLKRKYRIVKASAVTVCIFYVLKENLTFEPPRDKTNQTISAPLEDSDQPGHMPSLIRVFAYRMPRLI